VVLERDLPFDDFDDIYCRVGLRFVGEAMVSSHPALSIERFLLRLGGAAAVQHEQPAERKPRTTQEQRMTVMEEYQWLSEDDFDVPQPRAQPRAASPRRAKMGPKLVGVKGSDLPTDAVVEPKHVDDKALSSDDPAEAVGLEDVGAIVAEMAWDDGAQEYFYISVLKGKWTELHCGVSANGICALARGGPPSRWCTAYEFKRQRAFYFGKYGRESASALSREYCRRGDFFYRQFLLAKDDGFMYTEAHIAAYVESEEWVVFLTDLDVDSEAFVTGLDLRKFAPRIGPPRPVG
jgi:hypothetical protein